MRISARRNIIKHFLFFIVLIFIFGISDIFIAQIYIGPNVTEKIYTKDFGVGDGYLKVKIIAKPDELNTYYYTFLFEIFSSGEVEAIKFTDIEYEIDKDESGGSVTAYTIHSYCYKAPFSLNYHENITIEGIVLAEFSVQGVSQTETFNFKVSQELVEPSWFETHGVLFIIIIELGVMLVLVLIIYIVNKRKINKDNLS